MEISKYILQGDGSKVQTPAEGQTNDFCPIVLDKSDYTLKTKDENGDVQTIGGGGSGFTKYTYFVELNQTGTNDPTANVIFSDLPNDPVLTWTRSGQGQYLATSSILGYFTEGKVNVILPTASGIGALYTGGINNADSIYLNTSNFSAFGPGFNPEDDLLNAGYSFLTIEVWL